MIELRDPAGPTSKERRGAALLITLVSIAVLAVLSTGAILGSMGEFRAGRNALVEQRALAVSEFGLNQQLSNWSAARNSMAIGAVDSAAVGVELGDTARVKITRLTTYLYSVASVGRASIGNGQLEAQRQATLLVRLAFPNIDAQAAVTTASDLEMKGSATVSGDNQTPFLWADCAPYASADTFAIVHAGSAELDIDKPHNLDGGTYADPSINPATFAASGSVFASLAAMATITVGSSSKPLPVGTATTCTYGDSNWGEPLRFGLGVGLALGCRDHFPIVYAPGDLAIHGGRGQGILLVDGDLQVNGDFEFYGLIVVRGKLDKANGTFDVMGGVLLGGDGGTKEQELNGKAHFQYSKCAIEKAKFANATPVRTRQRSWAPVY